MHQALSLNTPRCPYCNGQYLAPIPDTLPKSHLTCPHCFHPYIIVAALTLYITTTPSPLKDLPIPHKEKPP